MNTLRSAFVRSNKVLTSLTEKVSRIISAVTNRSRGYGSNVIVEVNGCRHVTLMETMLLLPPDVYRHVPLIPRRFIVRFKHVLTVSTCVINVNMLFMFVLLTL